MKACFTGEQAAESLQIDPDDPAKGNIAIRVGLASGPVTATVLGSRNPKYIHFLCSAQKLFHDLVLADIPY